MIICMMPKSKLKNGLSPSFERRFLRRVVKTSKCWIWTGPLTNGGYGRITYGGISTTGLAHRASWIFFNNKPIPLGLEVLHKCDNRRCVNPNHLHIGTQKDNIREMVERRRGIEGEDHPCSKLSNKDVLRIRGELRRGNISRKKIAKSYSVSASLIDRIAWGKIRKRR